MDRPMTWAEDIEWRVSSWGLNGGNGVGNTTQGLVLLE
jgi:hypothetical protein